MRLSHLTILALFLGNFLTGCAQKDIDKMFKNAWGQPAQSGSTATSSRTSATTPKKDDETKKSSGAASYKGADRPTGP